MPPKRKRDEMEPIISLAPEPTPWHVMIWETRDPLATRIRKLIQHFCDIYEYIWIQMSTPNTYDIICSLEDIPIHRIFHEFSGLAHNNCVIDKQSIVRYVYVTTHFNALISRDGHHQIVFSKNKLRQTITQLVYQFWFSKCIFFKPIIPGYSTLKQYYTLKLLCESCPHFILMWPYLFGKNGKAINYHIEWNIPHSTLSSIQEIVEWFDFPDNPPEWRPCIQNWLTMYLIDDLVPICLSYLF
jgi:hypothetical protein